MDDTRPLLAITMGDPAGVGPEVICRSWMDTLASDIARRVIVGRVEVIRRAAASISPRLNVVQVSQADHRSPLNEIPVIEVGDDSGDSVAIGKDSAAGGEIAFQAIRRATELAIDGSVDGIVTAPISKRALHMGGYSQWPGHTEMLADLCGVKQTVMMLYLSSRCPLVKAEAGLGVIHATLHMSMRQAIDALNEKAILNAARLANRFAGQILAGEGLTRSPRIGVAALNPHAGEQGLFGDEEIRLIAPAVRQGVAEGLPLTGPLPCDTLMHRAADGEFDSVVAMYHDQGHIALKLLGLHHAVNVTLGLPVIRTSVAHGTAYDIAWKGLARSSSLVEAIRVASHLHTTRGMAASDRETGDYRTA